MTDAIAARPPVTASPPPARGSLGPAPGDDPEIENYDADFSELWQNPDEGMTFGDLLDIINPLQHIPVVSSIYRMVTGDTIGVGSRLAGGALFAGIPGLIAGALAATVENASGASLEEHLLALFQEDAPPSPQVAAAAAVGGADPGGDRPDPGGKASPASAPMAPVATTKPLPAAAPGAAALFTARPAPPLGPAPTPAAERPQAAPAPQESRAAPSPPAAGAEAAEGDRDARAAKRAAERERIAETLARARAQQTALLLANLSPETAEARKRPAADDGPAPRRAAFRSAMPAEPAPSAPPGTPVGTHPFLLPPGASPEQVSRAMERALSKYHQNLQARRAAR